jgi:hypothetical protein
VPIDPPPHSYLLPPETVSQSSSFIRQATTNGRRRGALKIPLYPPLKKRGNFLQLVLIPHDPIALPLFEKEGLGEICVRRKTNNTLRHSLPEEKELIRNQLANACEAWSIVQPTQQNVSRRRQTPRVPEQS